eukprot:3094243-Pleurochrysis_carterae.AAC.4
MKVSVAFRQHLRWAGWHADNVAAVVAKGSGLIALHNVLFVRDRLEARGRRCEGGVTVIVPHALAGDVLCSVVVRVPARVGDACRVDARSRQRVGDGTVPTHSPGKLGFWRMETFKAT